MADGGTAAEKPKRVRKPREPIQVSEGWYIPRPRGEECDPPPPRWVLAIGNGHCYYSRGDSTHFECSIETMRRWITRYKAKHPEKRS